MMALNPLQEVKSETKVIFIYKLYTNIHYMCIHKDVVLYKHLYFTLK